MSTSKKNIKIKIVMKEGMPDDELPAASLFMVDQSGKVIFQQDFSNTDKLNISADVLNKSDKIWLTRQSQELDTFEGAVQLTHSQIIRAANTDGLISLSRRRWLPWLPLLDICVDGNTRKCSWRPFVVDLLADTMALAKTNATSPLTLSRSLLSPTLENAALQRAPTITNFVFPGFHSCRPVCEGIVEVYERICCLTIKITPPIVVDICDILKERLKEIPRIPEPINPEYFNPPASGPRPDPIPYETKKLFKSGAIDEVTANAAADFQALSTLPLQEARKYILARPYLIQIVQTCSTPVHRGASAIGANGEFSVCYTVPLNVPSPGICRREVAFKITQVLDSGSRVIYDGVTAGKWFNPSDEITLTTYDPFALACDPEPNVPGPEGTAYVALARIGNKTDSVHLDSPDQIGDFKLGAMDPTSGLAYPNTDLNNAKGKQENLNWGSSLPLKIDFSKEMSGTNAKFYRISVARANSLGQPVESTRKYLDEIITWIYNEPIFQAGVLRVKKRAKMLTYSADPTFHKIPYDALIPTNASWRDNQYHGTIRTPEFDNGRHLVTIELFDENFERVIPASGQFSYETWNMPDHTTTVPYGALTHLFWWDNRALTTVIEDLRKNGTPSIAECQFLSKNTGDSDANFRAGFRAYHPHHGSDLPDFLLSWHLEWSRGLNGDDGDLDSGVESVGLGPLKESEMASFKAMLGSNTKCTFSLLLYAAAKTWNGSNYVNPHTIRDVASFALDVSEPEPETT